MLPVTLLTGFLGSGKTTLLKYLLENYHGEKIAIVENEFGEVSIDSALLGQAAPLTIIELNNGCICCNVRGDLTEALHDLLDKIDRKEIVVDRLILETTGLADPAPIIQTFFVNERIRERIVLDAVITLVSLEHIMKQLDEHRVAASQIGFADRIILTKTDSVTAEKREEILRRIYHINAKSAILEANFGALPKELWLGIEAFNLDSSLDLNSGTIAYRQDGIQFTPFSPREQSHICDTHCTHDAHHKHSFSDNITSHAFRAKALDIDAIGAFMEATIEQYGNDMLRYKGVLAIENEDKKLIVQGIHKVIGFDYGDDWKTDEKRESLLIIIGRDLPFDELKEGFLTTQASK